jgi:glycosyltransferase involved in cell wall biosynthesis
MESWFGLYLRTASVLGYSIVWTAHDILPHDQIFDDDLRATKLLISKASAVIALSEATALELRALGAHNVRVIPMGSYAVPYPVTLTTEEARASFGFSRDDVVVILIGRMEEYKGADLLLLAATQLPPTSKLKVLLVGTCSNTTYRRSLSRLASEAGARVTTVLEWVPDNEVARYLQAADIAAFPFREVTNSGSVRLAQSFGRPVVIPDLPNLRDVPQDTAIRFEPRIEQGVEPLVEALRHAEQLSEAEYRDMSAAALTWATNTKWPDAGRDTIETYREVSRPPN